MSHKIVAQSLIVSSLLLVVYYLCQQCTNNIRNGKNFKHKASLLCNSGFECQGHRKPQLLPCTAHVVATADTWRWQVTMTRVRNQWRHMCRLIFWTIFGVHQQVEVLLNSMMPQYRKYIYCTNTKTVSLSALGTKHIQENRISLISRGVSLKVTSTQFGDGGITISCRAGSFGLASCQIDWLYQSFTAHQHQKAHTVPKQVSPLEDDDAITESTGKKCYGSTVSELH